MKLFLPQKTLEEWSTAEKADIQDGKLVVKEGNVSHQATPAVHFVRSVSGSDPSGLVGRVKTMDQLQALGAERFADSVVMGEAAYEVSEGYLTEVVVAPGAKGDPKKKGANPEADLLAAFILDKL